MKKVLLWSVVLMLSISMIAAFSLSGCKEEEPVEEAVEEEAEEEVEEEEPEEVVEEEVEEEKKFDGVTLSIMIHGDSPTKEWIELFSELVEEELGIKSIIELTLGGVEGETITKTRIAAGELPDITEYNVGALLQALNPAENFYDISNEPYAENISEDFKAAASVGDKLFGIPTAPGTVGGWLYNKKIYEELGLEIPTTWEQLMDNCQKVQDAGYTAVLGTYGDSWTAQIVVLADYYNVSSAVPDFAEKYTANEAHYADTPEALRSFEKLAETGKYLNKDFATLTYDDGIRALCEGEAAHFPMLTLAFAAISSTYPEAVEDIGIFPQPSDSADVNGFTTWEPEGWFVSKTSENLEAANAWMEWMSSQEAWDAYSTTSQIFGPLLIKGLTYPENVSPLVSEIQSYFDAGSSGPALEFISPVKGPNLAQICVEVGSGMRTALEGAKEYDKDVEKQAQQLGLEGW